MSKQARKGKAGIPESFSQSWQLWVDKQGPSIPGSPILLGAC